MDIINTLAIAIGLAMDAFSVSVTAGMVIPRPGPRHYFRLAFHFGLFQAVMPLLGYVAGTYAAVFFEETASFIAAGLLGIIGIRMIYESITQRDEHITGSDPSRGIRLIMLSIATSVDALAVGASFGILGRPILVPALIIGATCTLLSALGVALGKRAGPLFGARAGAVGGIILIIIGIKIAIGPITG